MLTPQTSIEIEITYIPGICPALHYSSYSIINIIIRGQMDFKEKGAAHSVKSCKELQDTEN